MRAATAFLAAFVLLACASCATCATLTYDDPGTASLSYNGTLTTLFGTPAALARVRAYALQDAALAERLALTPTTTDAVFAQMLVQTGVFGGAPLEQSPLLALENGTLADALALLWQLHLWRAADALNGCAPGARFVITATTPAIVGECVPDVGTTWLMTFMKWQLALCLVAIALIVLVFVAVAYSALVPKKVRLD